MELASWQAGKQAIIIGEQYDKLARLTILAHTTEPCSPTEVLITHRSFNFSHQSSVIGHRSSHQMTRAAHPVASTEYNML